MTIFNFTDIGMPAPVLPRKYAVDITSFYKWHFKHAAALSIKPGSKLMKWAKTPEISKPHTNRPSNQLI
jgi:hypothetical protein